MRKNINGFTIVEMLVAIMVIGILATMAVFTFSGVQRNSRDLTRESRAKLIATSLESYYLKNGEYPSCSALSQSASTVVANTLTDLKADDLTTPTAAAGTNSIQCGSISNTQSDVFAYTGDCDADNKYCSSYTLRYIDEGKSTVDSIKSKHAKPCPTNFILVPGSSTYGTSDFCVMKYEAKIYGNDNGAQTYSSSNLPNSRASGTPYVSISQTNLMPTGGDNMAAKTVDAQGNTIAGAHLITEAEWMTIAQNVLKQPQNWSGGSVGSGFVYTGHVNWNPSNTLAADTNDNNSNYGETTYDNSKVAANNKRTLVLSNGEIIWDLVGNATEWTNGQTAGGQPGVAGAYHAWREWISITTTGSLSVNPFPSGTNIPGASSWTSSNGIGRVYSSADDTTLYGISRGFDFASGQNAGVLALYIYTYPSAWYSTFGFRVTAPTQ